MVNNLAAHLAWSRSSSVFASASSTTTLLTTGLGTAAGLYTATLLTTGLTSATWLTTSSATTTAATPARNSDSCSETSVGPVGIGIHEVDLWVVALRIQEIELHVLEILQVGVYEDVHPLVRQVSEHLAIHDRNDAVHEVDGVRRIER